MKKRDLSGHKNQAIKNETYRLVLTGNLIERCCSLRVTAEHQMNIGNFLVSVMASMTFVD
jgi:hypothetical protein